MPYKHKRKAGFDHAEYLQIAHNLVKSGVGGLFAPNEEARQAIRKFQHHTTSVELSEELVLPMDDIRRYRAGLREENTTGIKADPNLNYVAYFAELHGYVRYGFEPQAVAKDDSSIARRVGVSMANLENYATTMRYDVRLVWSSRDHSREE